MYLLFYKDWSMYSGGTGTHKNYLLVRLLTFLLKHHTVKLTILFLYKFLLLTPYSAVTFFCCSLFTLTFLFAQKGWRLFIT